MTSGGREVDVGGKGPHSNNILDFIIERSNNSQDPRHSQERRPGNEVTAPLQKDHCVKLFPPPSSPGELMFYISHLV